MDIGYIITLLVSHKSNCQATTNIYNLYMYTSCVIFPSTLLCPTSSSTTLYLSWALYLGQSQTPSQCNFNCGSSIFQQTMIFNLLWPKHHHCNALSSTNSLLLSIISSLPFPTISLLGLFFFKHTRTISFSLYFLSSIFNYKIFSTFYLQTSAKYLRNCFSVCSHNPMLWFIRFNTIQRMFSNVVLLGMSNKLWTCSLSRLYEMKFPI